MKAYSPACERNKDPILEKLRLLLDGCHHVLEIGSGTGQHAVYFAKHMKQLVWHSSDLADNHESISEWITESGLDNLYQPIVFNVNNPPELNFNVDAVFTANTCHIMSFAEVEAMFRWVAEILPMAGKFIIYGPFKYQGQHTAPSNVAFDKQLRANKQSQGIRDIIDIKAITKQLRLKEDYDLPANNRLLVFEKY